MGLTSTPPTNVIKIMRWGTVRLALVCAVCRDDSDETTEGWWFHVEAQAPVVGEHFCPFCAEAMLASGAAVEMRRTKT